LGKTTTSSELGLLLFLGELLVLLVVVVVVVFILLPEIITGITVK